MKSLLLAATAITMLAGPAYASDWWQPSLRYWDTDKQDFTDGRSCALAENLKSPAEAYRGMAILGKDPSIINNGAEVIVTYDSGDLRYYRSEQACRDAVRAARTTLDPYR